MRVLEAPPIILRLQQLITRCRFLTVYKDVTHWGHNGQCVIVGSHYFTPNMGSSCRSSIIHGHLWTLQYGRILSNQAERDEQICIIFDKLSINERGTHLLIFDGQLSSGEPKYNLGQHSSASSLCSTGRYLTVKLEKENYRSTSYQFELRILEESQTDGLINGLNGFVMSVGVIIAIIICVVVLITVFAVVIVCCCCKTGGISQSKGIKMNRQSGPQQGCSNQRPAPSAPPLQEFGHDGYHSVPIQDGEPPPAYSEQPPPYTTTDIPS
ncbi:unnamed protein product [Mytilus coruscus]|uniref:Uncharacterized protein n=1 Tax=Mytilus coruscus TaxID=42192 RepID=A0A6J7ZVQ6_MYTCO|nr:unnamed protein product [Mytilus coruscus]